mgnify:CR=1 FL=1
MSEKLPFDTTKKGLSIGALVCGILSVLCFWNPIGLLLGMLGAVLGGSSLYKRVGRKGAAVAGIVLGILSLVLFFAGSIIVHIIVVTAIENIFTFLLTLIGLLAGLF